MLNSEFKPLALVLFAASAISFPRPAAAQQGTYDLARDFSATNSLARPWSYGSKTNIAGAFTLLSYYRAGVPESWEHQAGVWPAIYHNNSSSAVTSEGGQGVFPPNSVWLAAGENSTPRNFGVIRFTVPEGTSGDFLIETRARSGLVGSSSSDADLYVARNGVELFGINRPPSSTNWLGYTNILSLAAGDTIDLLVGRGNDGSQPGSLLLVEGRITSLTTNVPPPPPPATYDVSRDFSRTANPNGVWSYGWQGALDGAYNLLTVSGTVPYDNGVPVDYWRFSSSSEPALFHNGTTNIAISNGGAGMHRPGSIFFFPGPGGSGRQFGTIRFTAPVGGNYQVVATAGPYVNGPPQGDADFHIVRNGVQVFGTNLPAGSNTAYTAVLALAAGQTIDFAVGPGTDNNSFGSALELTAQITVATNVPPPPPQSNCIPAPSGLVAWWPFEGDGQDVVGTNNGVLLGVPGFGAGEVDTALFCDGINDTMRVAASPLLNLAGTNAAGLTLEGWLRPGTINAQQALLEWNDAAALLGVHFWLSQNAPQGNGPGCLYANLIDAGGSAHFFATPAGIVRTGVWQHVALTYNRASGQASIYVNGTNAVQQNLGIFSPATGALPLWFAQRPNGGGSFRYLGGMDEWSIYNRALTASEIGQIVQADGSGKCRTNAPPPPPPPPAGFVVNGSFEFGINPGNTLPISAVDSNTITGWTVQSGSIDYIGTRWMAGDGVRSVDLSGTGVGSIRQEIPGLTAGRGYRLSFLLAGNPELGPTIKQLRASIAGVSQEFSFDITGRSGANMGWVTRSMNFTATGAGVSLVFTSLTESLAGPALDRISIVELDGVPPSTNCLPAPSGLAVWLPLNGNSMDAIGGSFAQLNGSPAFVAAEVGQGLRFDGTDDSARLPANAAIDVGAGPGMTAELWLRPDQLNSPRALLEWSPPTGSAVGVHLFTESGGSLYVNLIDTSNVAHSFSSPSGVLSTGIFQHVALTYNRASGVARLFVNAAPVSSNSVGDLRLETRPDLYLGQRILGGTPYRYSGIMDEVSLYNRALSTAELQAIYTAGAAGKCAVTNPPPPPPPPTNCVPAIGGLAIWLPFDGNSMDVIGGGVAQLNGSPAFVTGEVGQGLGFDGTDDSARLPAGTRSDIGAATGMTAEMWIRPEQLNSPRALLEWSPPTGSAVGVHLFTESNGRLFVNLIDTNNSAHSFFSPAGVLSAGVFQHVALTYARTSGVARLFVNGTTVASQAVGSFRPETRSDLYLGQRILGGTPYRYSGVMDEVSLYNRALSETELQAIYLAGALGKCGVTNVPPPPPSGTHDLSRDFTLTSNPNGVWSYGYLTELAGNFGLLRAPRTFGADNGVQIGVWELSLFRLPVVAKVLGPGTAISDGGRFTAPAGTVYFAPGADGAPENYGDIRFTVPPGGDGLYRIETAVRSLFDSSRSRDADFHVVHNGTELFGQFLPPNSVASYSNTIPLYAGDRVDFAVGRGADALTLDTGLKIQTVLTLLTNLPPPPPPPPPTNCIAAALESLAALIDLVENSSAEVNTRPLLASLRAAQASFQRGSVTSAINQLFAFQNKARAQVARNNAALAADLIAQADAVINAANCVQPAVALRAAEVQTWIESLTPLVSGGARLTFSGFAGAQYEVQVSENLTKWRSAGLATEITGGVFEYVDSQEPRPAARFYRVVKVEEQSAPKPTTIPRPNALEK